MTNGLGLSAMGRTIHRYPTVAEAYRNAADQWRKRKLTPLARRVLDLWFRLFGLGSSAPSTAPLARSAVAPTTTAL